MDGHSSTSQVRVLSSSSSNPNYDWVLPEVLEKPSEYLSVQSIQKFRDEYDIGVGNPKVESSIVVEPCLPEEGRVLPRVSEGGRWVPSFSSLLVEQPESDQGPLGVRFDRKSLSRCHFLKSLKKKNLSCCDIIEAKGDPAALEHLFGKNRDKSTSTSQNSQSQGPSNPTPTGTPPPPSPKRQRLEGTSDNTANPTATSQPNLEMIRPPSVDRIPEKWWLYFREFESSEDMEVTSIFYHRFQMADIIEGNLCKAADRSRIQKVDLRNTTTMAQSMAARTTFLAHGLGHGIDVLEKENFDLKQKFLSEEVESQKLRIKEPETANQSLTTEKTEMTSTITVLRGEKDQVQASFDAAKIAWQAEEELNTDLALYHGNGFNKAIEQVKFLHPDINLSEVAKSETWLANADSQSRLEKFIKPSPRLGGRSPTPGVGWRNLLSQVRDLVGEHRLPESVGEIYLSQVRDLVGEHRLPESVGEIYLAKSETWLANADSQSRLEKFIKPSPRLGGRSPTPGVGWRNLLSQVRDLVGERRLPESVGEI
ncbi:hypothetical protein SESBI_31019 [Sesbania bispinosa]|nr:hypothetical protein SESBI_31019 [Sesbania bispinosa]